MTATAQRNIYLMLRSFTNEYHVIMPNQFKKSIKRVNRLLKAMLPKRCNKRSKEDGSNLNDGGGNEKRTEGSFDPAIPCSPKKRRDSKASENSPYVPPAPTHFKYALDPPLQDDENLHPTMATDHIQTPPVLTSSIASPPRLQQRNVMFGFENDGVPPLPLLPSDLINDDSSNYAPKFKLNPRLQWNPEMISRQLQSREQTLSSLLKDHNDDAAIPPNPPRSIISKVVQEFSENVTIDCDLIQPTPTRHGSAALNSAERTMDLDNTTFISTIADENCCAWFSPSWTSAFDATDRQSQNFDKA